MKDPDLDGVERAMRAVEQGLVNLPGHLTRDEEREREGPKHPVGATRPTRDARAAASRKRAKAARVARRKGRG